MIRALRILVSVLLMSSAVSAVGASRCAESAEPRVVLSHIVAAGLDGTIGAGGKMPWHLPEDLKHFRRITRGKPVIMGRKTFEALPSALPERLNIVISRDAGYKAPGAVVVQSLEAALAVAKSEAQSSVSEHGAREIFIIGGGQLFRETIAMVDRVYFTQIHREFSGDTAYPVGRLKEFELKSSVAGASEVPLTFQVYERRRATP